jgi:hypothetical protein
MRALFIAAAVLAISMYTGAQERPPNSMPASNSRGGSRISNLKTSQKTDETKEADTGEPRIPPCNQTSPCYVVDEPQSKTEEQKSKESSLDTLTRRYMWATIIGVVGGFIGIALIFWQTRIAGRSANAANIAAEASKKQSEAMITGARAWILADVGEIPDTFVADSSSVGFLDVRPLVRNSGQTPGSIKKGFIRSHKIANGSVLPPQPDYTGPLATQEVYVIVPPNTVVQPLHVPIPLSDFVAIRQGNPTLYIYGFIDYVDFAKQERQTRFCFEYHVPHGFDPQPRGFYISVNVPLAYIECT